VKVDEERFVDLLNMLQRRFDDTSKRRAVKREDSQAPQPTTADANADDNESTLPGVGGYAV